MPVAQVFTSGPGGGYVDPAARYSYAQGAPELVSNPVLAHGYPPGVYPPGSLYPPGQYPPSYGVMPYPPSYGVGPYGIMPGSFGMTPMRQPVAGEVAPGFPLGVPPPPPFPPPEDYPPVEKRSVNPSLTARA